MTHQNDAFNSGLQALTKLVLTTDYTSKPGQVADAYARSSRDMCPMSPIDRSGI